MKFLENTVSYRLNVRLGRARTSQLIFKVMTIISLQSKQDQPSLEYYYYLLIKVVSFTINTWPKQIISSSNIAQILRDDL